MNDPIYRRILLKVSGEALAGKGENVLAEIIDGLALEIKGVWEMDIEIGIVVGGGNIYRGASGSRKGIDQVKGDYMGMIATIFNALALQAALDKVKVPSRVQSALNIDRVAEPFIIGRTMRHFEKNRVVIFAAGTGNPFCTTDTAAVLRAAEIKAEVVLKATKVDGIYDCDPATNEGAKRFEKISCADAIRLNLKVMDSTAFTMCMERKIPIIVFDLSKQGNLQRVVRGELVGTLVIPNEEGV